MTEALIYLNILGPAITLAQGAVAILVLALAAKELFLIRKSLEGAKKSKKA